MAFKMKGFPFAGKSPMYKKEEKTSMYQKEEKTYPESYTEEDKKFLKEQNEDVVREEDKRHLLYSKLTKEEKAAYNKLTDKEKLNVNKNKTLSQLRAAIANYEPEFENADEVD